MYNLTLKETMIIIITCEAHMSNGKKNRNREGVDPLERAKNKNDKEL